jgi:hypothetical protein
VLNRIRSQGDQLLHIDLIDEENRRLSLPVDAFDGVSFAATLQGLEQEWNAVLAQPLRTSSAQKLEGGIWYRQQLQGYENRIVDLELLINRIQRMRQQASDSSHTHDTRFQSSIGAILACYESQLNKMHAIRSRLLAGYQSV